jgi:hypothetical protein
MKKVNNFRLITALDDNFDLTDIDREVFTLHESIQPVTIVDPALRTTTADTTTTSAASDNHVYTVPAKKTWFIKSASAGRANSGNVSLVITIGGTAVSFELLSGVTGTQKFDVSQEIRLDAGDSADFSFATGTSGNLTSYIIYEEINSYT